MKTETDKTVFLQSKIPPGTETFLKQQGEQTSWMDNFIHLFTETLIVWNEIDEKGDMLDLALSFQDESGMGGLTNTTF